MSREKKRLFIDMDGTLVRFHDRSNYLEKMYEQNFFTGLQPFGNLVKAVKYLEKDYPQAELFTLSACIDSPFCLKEKNDWLDCFLPEIDTAHRVFVPFGADKSQSVPGGIQPTDYLLDDYNKNLENWEAAGGKSIKFINNFNHKGKVGKLWKGATIRYDTEASLLAFQIADKTKNLPSFEEQVELSLSNQLQRRDVIYVCNTPKALEGVGCRQLPMFLTQNHLKSMLHEKSSSNPHWHGLSTEQIKNLPELLSEPAIIFDSISPNNANGIMLVLNALDGDNLPLLAAVRPNGQGTYMLQKINSNFITSVYGRSTFMEHMTEVARQQKVLYIGKKSNQSLVAQAQLQLLRGHTQPDCYDNIIAQSQNIVNTHSMQSIQNNAYKKERKLLQTEKNTTAKVERTDGNPVRSFSYDEFNQIKQEIGTIAKTYQEDPKLAAEFFAFKAQFYQYSPQNSFLIHIQNPHATFVASFQRWKAMGYSIKKGAKHMKITRPIEKVQFPREINGKTEWKDIKYANNQEKVDIAAGKLKTRNTTSFVPFQVFDISQTTCPPEDYPKIYSMGYADIEHQEMYHIVKEYAQTSGFQVTEQDLQSISLSGYYAPADNRIVINSLLEDTSCLETMCHELAHGVLHQTSTQPTEIKEFEAECFSAMLQRKFGFPVSEQSKGYIKNYYNKCTSSNVKFDMEKTLNRLSKSFKHVNAGIDEIAKSRGHDLSPNREKNMEIAKGRSVSPADVSENFMQNL